MLFVFLLVGGILSRTFTAVALLPSQPCPFPLLRLVPGLNPRLLCLHQLRCLFRLNLRPLRCFFLDLNPRLLYLSLRYFFRLTPRLFGTKAFQSSLCAACLANTTDAAWDRKRPQGSGTAPPVGERRDGRATLAFEFVAACAAIARITPCPIPCSHPSHQLEPDNGA